MRNRRIAILMHEEDSEEMLEYYLVSRMAECWREDGHEVFFLFGTDQFVPADLLFVHVDLSVVPERYRAFADRYPVAVNNNVKDIRKSTFSPGLLHPGDEWDGPVIVKSDKNYAGLPDRDRGGLLATFQRKLFALVDRLDMEVITPSLRTPYDYPVYDHLEDVPWTYFYNPNLVVQKFMPETENGHYCVRILEFLGDRLTSMRLKGSHPIIKGGTTEVVEYDIEPHPEIVSLREQFQFDYGKFDYVVTDGEAVLLDVNKTVGYTPSFREKPEMIKRRRYRAEGLYSFFEA